MPDVDDLRAYLIGLARERRTTRYTTAASALGISEQYLWGLLNLTAEKNEERGEPLLCSLIVGENGLPGKGYFERFFPGCEPASSKAATEHARSVSAVLRHDWNDNREAVVETLVAPDPMKGDTVGAKPPSPPAQHKTREGGGKGLIAALAALVLIGGGGAAAYFGGMFNADAPAPGGEIVLEADAPPPGQPFDTVEIDEMPGQPTPPADDTPPASEPFDSGDQSAPEPEPSETAAERRAREQADAEQRAADLAAAERAEAVRGLQRELRRLGHYTNAIDGDAGPGTQAATNAFTDSQSRPRIRLASASTADIEALTARASRADPPAPPFDARAARGRGNAARNRGDHETANREYAPACEAGDAFSCNELGYNFQFARGVPQDYARARTLYTQACDGGNVNGCGGLGTLYYDGKGVPVDKTRSRQLHQKACDGGEASACSILERFYD